MKDSLAGAARIGTLLGAALLLPAPAATAQEAATASPAPWYTRVQLDGFVGASWSYNFGRPASRANTLRVFDFDDNSIKVDVLEVVLQKNAVEPRSGGFRCDLAFGGSVPRVTAARDLFRDASGVAEDLDLQQAFVRWVAPLGRGLRLDAGKFITPFGYEVIEGYDGFNDNATRSFAFGYGIPFTHTGLRAGLDFGRGWSGTLLAVNGWDVATDNNAAKSVGGQLSFAAGDRFSCAGTAMAGAERSDSNDDLRSTYGITATWQALSRLRLGAEGLYAQEAGVTPSQGTAVWDAVVGYARVAIGSRASIALRGEWFHDRDASRTALAQNLVEGTWTTEVRLSDTVRVRADVRLDHSDRNVFHKHSVLAEDQCTVLVAALSTF